MPSKNEVKIYVGDSFYHLYNRGVEKRRIFQDNQDYSVFLDYLKTYLIPKDEKNLRMRLADPMTPIREKDNILKLLQLNNFYNKLNLIAFCLMPNHFHFLVHQVEGETIRIFMNSLITRYSMYFNRKYKRVGPLFQGVYKAVLLETDEQLLHLSRYIHLQAIFDPQGQPLQMALPSSYPNYLGERTQDWIKPDKVLTHFKISNLLPLKRILSYKSFVENYLDDAEQIIQELLLE